MKQDYFYTSPLGRRMFQLDLGPLTLALIGSPDHKTLDSLVADKGSRVPLCKDILDHSRINYAQYMRDDAPKEEQFTTVTQAAERQPFPGFVPPLPPAPTAAAPAFSSAPSPSDKPVTGAAAILQAVAVLPARRKKGEGSIADEIAQRLNVSPSTVYQAIKIYKHGGDDLIERVKKGEVGIKKAFKSLKQKEAM